MGCSSSTLSISDAMPMFTTSTTDPPGSGCAFVTCYGSPPVLQPPPNAARSIVDPSSGCPLPDPVNDTSWDLIHHDEDDPDEEEYHVVDRNQYKNNNASSLRKLLETYEFVQQQHLSPVDQDDLDYAPSASPNTSHPRNNNSSDSISTAKKVVILYITSMSGIRKTYGDCCAIKSILDGFRVAVVLRDIAMDVKYRRELQSLLGFEGKAVTVPQLFIGAKLVGGADQVRQLHESGELSKLLEGCPVRGSTVVPCTCGDARFLMCAHCSGSRKVFDEEHRLLRKCSRCNENGLVECPTCNT